MDTTQDKRYPCQCDDGLIDRYTAQRGSEITHHGTTCMECGGDGYLELDIESAMARELVTRNEAVDTLAELGYSPEEIEHSLIVYGLMQERKVG